jgi:hypothetical protein
LQTFGVVLFGFRELVEALASAAILPATPVCAAAPLRDVTGVRECATIDTRSPPAFVDDRAGRAKSG